MAPLVATLRVEEKAMADSAERKKASLTASAL
jgi:hypothetical protein